MAIYNFKCEKCKKVYEVEIPMNEYNKLKDKQTCKKCNGKLNRVFNKIAGTIYNCGGFYDTDCRGISGR